MNNKKETTATARGKRREYYAADSPEMTAGIWNKRKVKGGTFLKKSDLIELINKAETLPEIKIFHGKEYPQYFDGQEEPEPLPAEIPPAIIKTAKRMRTGKAPTAQIYLPAEYGGRPVLVMVLTPETYYLINRAERRRQAIEILKADPENEIVLFEETQAAAMINEYIKEISGADYSEALPDSLKKRTAKEMSFIITETLPDGHTITGSKKAIEAAKMEAIKKQEKTPNAQKPRTK